MGKIVIINTGKRLLDFSASNYSTLKLEIKIYCYFQIAKDNGSYLGLHLLIHSPKQKKVKRTYLHTCP